MKLKPCQKPIEPKPVKLVGHDKPRICLDQQQVICLKVKEATGISVQVAKPTCDRCEKDPEELKRLIAGLLKAKSIAENPYKNLSITQLGINFAQAMKRAAKAKFAKVSKQVYIERMICCTTCGGKGRCPYCGCLRGVKAWLKSEARCPDKKTYPNLVEVWKRRGLNEADAEKRAYPLRNYWQVCDEITSVIIPARNEVHLNKTIEAVLAKATGKIEVIVILDGCDQDVYRDNRVKVIRHPEPQGIRASVNEAAAQAGGTYLFKLDGHCTLSDGWDTRLKCICGDNNIAVATIRQLDPQTWTIPDGANYGAYVYLDDYFQWQWDTSRQPYDHWPLIGETSSFIGLAFMIKKEYFEQLGGFDNLDYGMYGYIGPELTLKVLLHPLNPGKILFRKDVTCGHVFYQSNQESPHGVIIKPPPAWRKIVLERWGEDARVLVKGFDGHSDILATGFSINAMDWAIMKKIIAEHNVKTAVEFGAGVSTRLMDRTGLDVHSYETDAGLIEYISKLTEYVTYCHWDGVTPQIVGTADMALIDGPYGGENREPSYKSVADSDIKIVACHDSNRPADKAWIEKYFASWKVLAHNTGQQGMMIFLRP